MKPNCFPKNSVYCLGVPIPMKQALADRSGRSDDLIASGPQVDMVFKRGKRSEKALTLRAQKIWHLLVKKAGAKLGDNVTHAIELSELRALGHQKIEDRIDALRELQTVLVEVTHWRDGKRGVASGPLLSYVWRPDDDQGVIEWRFSAALKIVFAHSDHWAILSKRAVMAFESRYSLRLYEIISLRSGLDYKASEVFELEDLRNRLGVPIGKMEEWFDIRRFVLEPAIAEVNQLARFNVAYDTIKKGRSVAAVKLTWGEKLQPERKETKRELGRSKVGRKARRLGAGNIFEPANAVPERSMSRRNGFPSDGSISFGEWGELARQHAPRPTPDVDLIASAFRKWTYEKQLPLDSKGIEKAFIGFCKGFKMK